MDVQVQAVECDQNDDRGRDWNRQRAGEGPRSQALDDEGDQAIRDHSANHVTARKAVGEWARARDELRQARSVGVRHRARRPEVMEIRLVQNLEHLRGDEHQDHPGVGAEASADQEDREAGHQYRRQFETAQLSDRLEEGMQRFAPEARHPLQHLLVEHVQSAGGEGHRQCDEGDRERGGGYKPRPQCWQRRQNTVERPAMRTIASGRPQVTQGSPARP